MMEEVKAIFLKTRASWHLILPVFLIQLVFSLWLDANLFSNLKKELGQSTSDYMEGYDFNRTLIGDILNNNENFLSDNMQMATLLLVLQLLLAIILHTVLLQGVKNPKVDFISSIRKIKIYGLPFLGYALLYYTVSSLLVLAGFYAYFAVLGDPAADYKNELPFVYSLLAVLLVMVCLLLILSYWSVATRLKYLETSRFLHSLKAGWGTIAVKKRKVFLFLFVDIVVLLILLWLYVSMQGVACGTSGWTWFWVLFGIHFLLLFRLIWRYFTFVFISRL